MTRSYSATGFGGRTAPVASTRLIDAVVASLAFSAFSLCLVVAATALSVKAGMALPI